MDRIELIGWPEFAAIARVYPPGKWMFRGVTNFKHTLTPTIGRANSRSGDRPYSASDEVKIFERFQQMALPHLAYHPQSNLEWLAVAQHHGLPTRLPDWTESPFVAGYFAVRKGTPDLVSMPLGEALKHSPDSVEPQLAEREREFKDLSVSVPVHAAVIGVKIPETATQENRNYPLRDGAADSVAAFRPPHLTPRITVQQALLTLYPSPPASWSPTEMVVWMIPPKQILRFKVALSTAGINQSTMFPDLDGICGHLQWLYWRNFL